MSTSKLDSTNFPVAVKSLCRRDNRLASVVDRIGLPPFWIRSPGWKTLVKIILEQQVSLESGRAVYRRLHRSIQPFTLENLSQCRSGKLRAAGLTRQKSVYCRDLARALLNGSFNLSQIARLDDNRARESLCELKGIGPWTANVYLLMALRRADIWPPGDIALIRAIEELYGIPDEQSAVKLTESWSPWRAVAARILWHDYLDRRGRSV